MKVKIIDRILLAFYAFLGVIGAAAAVFLMIYRESFSLSIMNTTLVFQSGWFPTVIILAVIALVLLLWSIKIFALAFRREPKMDVPSVSVQNTEDGSVRISLEAMDTLVKQAIGHQEGILDVQAKIINHEDSISIRVDMVLTSDVHIPNVTMLLQRTIKNFVEEFSGIAVREVTVLVSSIVEVVPVPLAIETKGVEDDVHSVEEETIPNATETSDLDEILDDSLIEDVTGVTSDPETVILDEGSSYLPVEDAQETIEISNNPENNADEPIAGDM